MAVHSVTVAGIIPSCPAAGPEGTVPCFYLSQEGAMVVENQAHTSQRNFKIHIANVSTLRIAIDQSQTVAALKYTNLMALLHFERVPREWDFATAQMAMGTFGMYTTENRTIECTLSQAPEGSVITGFSGEACHSAQSGGMPGYQQFSRGDLAEVKNTTTTVEYYSTTTTTVSAGSTVVNVVRHNRTFMSTSLYMSVYCLGPCNYSIVLRSNNSFVQGSCPGASSDGNESVSGLDGPTNGLCCQHGCSKAGRCVVAKTKDTLSRAIDPLSHETECVCNMFRKGAYCQLDAPPSYWYNCFMHICLALLILFSSNKLLMWFAEPHMMDEDMDHHRRQQAERKRKLSALAKKRASSVQPQKTIELTPVEAITPPPDDAPPSENATHEGSDAV